MLNENENEYTYEGTKPFLEICLCEYERELERNTKLENKASMLITVILAVLGVVASNFNISDLLEYEVSDSEDVIKIVMIILFFIGGVSSFIYSIWKLYQIAKPHDYETIHAHELFSEASICDENELVANMFIVANALEAINKNRVMLNKMFGEIPKIWRSVFIGTFLLIFSCVFTNIMI